MAIVNKPAFAVGVAVLAFGLLATALAVSGALWPATPLGDPGLLSLLVTCVLLGLGAIAVSRFAPPEPGQ